MYYFSTTLCASVQTCFLSLHTQIVYSKVANSSTSRLIEHLWVIRDCEIEVLFTMTFSGEVGFCNNGLAWSTVRNYTVLTVPNESYHF